ncbi:MAG: HD domain-containing phosphohydrolase [bacterium]
MSKKEHVPLKEIYSICQWMGARVELKELLRRIMDSALKLVQADHGSLMLLNEETGELSIEVSSGLSQAIANSFKIRIGEPIAGLVAKEGKPLLLNHLTDDPRLTDYLQRKEIRSAISVPLKIRERVIGMLNLNLVQGGLSPKDIFTQEDAESVFIMGAQAAGAIENARLYKTVEQRLQELFTLNEVGRAIASTTDPEQIIKLTFSNLKKLVCFEIGSIFLAADKQFKFAFTSSISIPQTLILNLKDNLIQIFSRLIEQTIETEQILTEPIEVKEAEGTDPRPIKSQLTVPLICGEKVIGLLNINSLSEDIFHRDNLRIMTTFASQVSVALENARRFREIKEYYTGTIKALAAEIETRNPYTQRHSERVTEYAVLLAQRLSLSEDRIEEIKTAGLLHDLGKIGISDDILLKPDKLTSDEMDIMKTHPVKSGKIVGSLKFLQSTLPIIVHHHERYDGGGYPDQLAGDNIPLGARILAVADTFDAMTSSRPYRGPMSPEEAKNEIIKQSGRQFDPRVVEVFLKEYPQIKAMKEREG